MFIAVSVTFTQVLFIWSQDQDYWKSVWNWKVIFSCLSVRRLSVYFSCCFLIFFIYIHEFPQRFHPVEPAYLSVFDIVCLSLFCVHELTAVEVETMWSCVNSLTT